MALQCNGVGVYKEGHIPLISATSVKYKFLFSTCVLLPFEK